jgi:hypothetical protein
MRREHVVELCCISVCFEWPAINSSSAELDLGRPSASDPPVYTLKLLGAIGVSLAVSAVLCVCTNPHVGSFAIEAIAIDVVYELAILWLHDEPMEI